MNELISLSWFLNYLYFSYYYQERAKLSVASNCSMFVIWKNSNRDFHQSGNILRKIREIVEHGVKSMSFRASLPLFESCLHDWLAVSFWESYSRCLIFLKCKIRILIALLPKVIVRIKWGNTCKVLRTVIGTQNVPSKC